MTTYKFSRRIGRGGMAEVFLALQEGLGGFEKLVVVKKIFPHFCEDRQFVQMFFDEARLAASVRHPNVVEILDVCSDARGLFIVMEYLSGETAGFVHDKLRNNDWEGWLPYPIACRIAADVAAGLHCAHTSTDEEGKPREIVHRDVTPSNLLIGYSGATKVLDFGVAKASVERKDSEPGTLKGKLGYFAPELLEGNKIDRRADVFQLGVVLHEALTGQVLFKGENDHKTMVAVLERKIPAPSSINSNVPVELDRIVLGALQRDLRRRTHSADKLRRQLEEFLRDCGNVSHHDVGEWLQATFPKRYEERLALERVCVQELKKGRATSEAPAMVAPFAPTAPFEPITGQTAVTVLEIPSRPGVTRMTARRRRRNVRAVTFGAVGVAVLAVAGYLGTRGADGTARAGEPAGSASPAAAVQEPAVEPAPPPPADAGPAAQVASAPDSETAVPRRVQNSQRTHTRRPAPEPEPVMPTATNTTPTTATTTAASDRDRRPRTDNRDPWANE